VLPLANPLRIAEEAATLDHVSKGRLIFGVGRSGVVKTYEALNIAYSESKDREIECLEIIQAIRSCRSLTTLPPRSCLAEASCRASANH
jgi:alkanesulfonate monooxygenase SsuD/methylene tetrahydromethanopterin reductase-like flavin-dependent oxidoreductase (luciferase family)